MAKELGVVTEIQSDMALVKTARSAACEGCASKGSCMSKSSGEMIIRAVNQVGARVGDQVVISVATSAFLKVTFLLYVFPILGLMAGAMIGHYAIAPLFGLSLSGAAAVTGFVAMVASIVVVKRNANRMAGTDVYQPKIVRISHRAPTAVSTPLSPSPPSAGQ